LPVSWTAVALGTDRLERRAAAAGRLVELVVTTVFFLSKVRLSLGAVEGHGPYGGILGGMLEASDKIARRRP
jgi:hypothetical protein